jgi:CRP-like cAMP-binding protein
MIDPSSLQKYALFGGLLEDQISRILPLMEQKTYQARDNILTEGECNDRIYFMLEGCAEVRKNGIPLAKFKEGDTFGEMEILDVMPTAATIRALTPVSVIVLSNKALHEIYKTDLPAFAMVVMNLARDLSRRLRRMDEKTALTADIHREPLKT